VNPNRGFSENYRCFPIAMMQNGSERENVNYGGKSKKHSIDNSFESQLKKHFVSSYPASIRVRETL
jgi:hypothetical protein